MQEKIVQIGGTNSEHRHSKFEHFSMLNEHIMSQKTPSLSVVSQFSDLH